jgi:hypothetical protein
LLVFYFFNGIKSISAILASLMFSACNGVVNTVEESEAYTAEIAHIRNS